MASVEILRKDLNGHIISKNNKDYHISFKENIDIIEVISYKKYNVIGTDNYDNDSEEEKENEEDNKEEKTKGKFIDSYTKTKIEYFSNKDPHALSKGGCQIF